MTATVHTLQTNMLPARATPQELRQTRERMFGFTQAEFGQLLGVTEYSVYRWERGMRPMTEENTRAMRALVRQRLDAVIDAGTKAAG